VDEKSSPARHFFVDPKMALPYIEFTPRGADISGNREKDQT
jgi:hypothetical protein